MLDIFNDLLPFFRYPFREYGVREYARVAGVSPPTASTILKRLAREGLLIKRKERIYHLYKASNSQLYKDLKKAWRNTQ